VGGFYKPTVAPSFGGVTLADLHPDRQPRRRARSSSSSCSGMSVLAILARAASPHAVGRAGGALY
jgi:hypothetical protein